MLSLDADRDQLAVPSREQPEDLRRRAPMDVHDDVQSRVAIDGGQKSGLQEPVKQAPLVCPFDF
jgi:hypothetical protein